MPFEFQNLREGYSKDGQHCPRHKIYKMMTINIPFEHFGGMLTIKETPYVTLNFVTFRHLNIVIIIAHFNKQPNSKENDDVKSQPSFDHTNQKK